MPTTCARSATVAATVARARFPSTTARKRKADGLGAGRLRVLQRPVEERVGTKNFLIFYLGGGIAANSLAAVMDMLAHPGKYTPAAKSSRTSGRRYKASMRVALGADENLHLVGEIARYLEERRHGQSRHPCQGNPPDPHSDLEDQAIVGQPHRWRKGPLRLRVIQFVAHVDQVGAGGAEISMVITP